jgi:hypothetical protein
VVLVQEVQVVAVALRVLEPGQLVLEQVLLVVALAPQAVVQEQAVAAQELQVLEAELPVQALGLQDQELEHLAPELALQVVGEEPALLVQVVEQVLVLNNTKRFNYNREERLATTFFLLLHL